MFASYESEFTRVCMEATEKVSALERLLPGLERDAARREAEAAVEAAAEVVSQLEMEAGPDDKARVRECKSTLGQLRSKLSAARSSNRVAELQREALLQRADEPQRLEAEQQHTRLLETTSRMQRGTDKLRHACQVRHCPPAGATALFDAPSPPPPPGTQSQQALALPETRNTPGCLWLVAVETEAVGASISTDH